MKRWKLWHGIDGEIVRGVADDRIDSTKLEAVAYVAPESTGVRECREVLVGIDADGGVTVTHRVTSAPEADDSDALYPTRSVELYIPGWGEPGDWGSE